MTADNAWYTWFNGVIVPESDARVPFRDRGFKFGDAVFDTTRTFGHRIFKLDEHIERLYRSLSYPWHRPRTIVRGPDRGQPRGGGA